MNDRPRGRRVRQSLGALEEQISVVIAKLDQVMKRQQALDELIRDLHTDSWNLKTRLHADSWAAHDKRALSSAEAVALSLKPEILAMRDEVIAIIGEKAVEVFREASDAE